MKKAYFIGIAGKTMSALAKAFKEMGWQISGSDHVGVYPPVSTYLKENNIPYVEGYDAKNVPLDADLVIAGYSSLLVDSNNPEYLEAKKLGLKVLSFPEVLAEFLIKEKSIVVAGTYGKTTLSALIAWILTCAKLNPSYMSGGVLLNMPDGIKMTNSSWSVVEGDEVPSLLKTDPPKFMFYRPKYLLLTATIHDHPEIYKTPAEYLGAFIKLVRLLPKDGLLVYNSDHVDNSVIKAAACPKVSYSINDLKNISFYQTSLLGKFNLENICGAVVLCSALKINQEIISKSVVSFRGVKTRLEFLGKYGEKFIYWDFAQHPKKVKGSLEALREHYSRKRIICVFDPSATALKYKVSLNWYPGAFNQADQVIIGKVSFLKSISKGERVTGKDIVKAIKTTQPNVFYEPREEMIIKWLRENTTDGDNIIFMSSGGLRFANLIKEAIKKL